MKTRGFSLVEILVALAIATLLSAFLIPQLMKARDTTQLTVARNQALTMQTALDSWLAGQSVAGARAAFHATSGDYPDSNTTFLQSVFPYLSSDTQGIYRVSSTDPSKIVTDVMDENGWYIKIAWPAATWLTDHPRVEFTSQ